MKSTNRATPNRRTLLRGYAAALGVAVALTACSGGNEAAEGGVTDAVAVDPTGPFPVTVADKFGDVVVEQAPDVIASVGRTDHDVLLALGIVPATVYRFVPTMTRGVGAWAEPALGDHDPVVLTAPVDAEAVAAVEPDLILHVQSAGDETEYRTFSAIAPTIGLPPDTGVNSVGWQESVRIISTAVGRADDGDRLISDTEKYLDDVRADHPEFEGRTVAVVLTGGGDLGVYTSVDTRTLTLTALGFTPSPFVEGLGTDSYYTPLSPELVDQVDADVVVVLTREGLAREETLKAYPMLANSSANREGRLLVVEDVDTTLALSAGSVLSIPYAVDSLVPTLTEAVR